MTTELLATALELHGQGIHTMPARADGSKAPVLSGWQNHETTEAEIREWFAPGRHTALSIITGARSGNIEMAELEGRAADKIGELKELAEASGLGELWYRITIGWLEASPSGGIHWFYRVAGDPVPGNTKLATRPSTPEELAATPTQKVQTLAETRGTGGQVVAAPTGGHAHETGKPWTRLAGGPTSMATITGEEREAFLQLLRTLHQDPAPAEPAAPGLLGQDFLFGNGAGRDFEGTTPGDDYEQKTSWKDILEPAGWTPVFTRGTTTFWRRPGKAQGFSATTGHAQDRDRLWVWSSSTEFDTETPITKFHAYAVLNHNGDHSAAASALRGGGFGEAPKKAAGTKPERPDNAPAGQVTPDEDPASMILELTDDANAEALIRAYGTRLRYNIDTARWLVWRGDRWHAQPIGGGYARELAKMTARRLPEDGREGSTKTLKHKRYSLSERGVTALLNHARTDERLIVTAAQLDSHAWELNTPAGILDLRTGTLGPADPDKLHTRITSCAPDFDADRALLRRVLAQIFPDAEILGYVQRLFGYSAVGEVLDHVLPFCYGPGGNGKGTILEAVRAVLGDYAGAAPSGFLMATTYAKHETELADLSGLRLVICSEVNEEDKFDEAKVKRLTGGDTVKARFMRQDYFEFPPTHHLWLMGNHQPDVEAGGDGFWRRLRLIPFTNKVAEDQIIPNLQGILATDHGPALLAWIAEGARDYAAGGLREPAGVKAATADYAHDVDTIGRFLEDECYTGPSYADQAVKVTDLKFAYEKWCLANGEKPVTGRAFPSQLARHGVAVGRAAPKGNAGVRLYGGVLLKSDQDSLDPFAGDRGGR